MTPDDRLPRRFPVGTRLVIEGAPDPHGAFTVVSRYLVMPSGRRVDLSPRQAKPRTPRDIARRRASGNR